MSTIHGVGNEGSVASGENVTETPVEILGRRRTFEVAGPTKSAFFWLSAFFFVYCARPEDWIPGLKYVPLAKLTALLAMYCLFASLGRTKRTFKDVPQEVKLLGAII